MNKQLLISYMKFKIRPNNYTWALSTNVFKYIKEEYFIKEKYQDFRKLLDSKWCDYMNEQGRVIDVDNKPIEAQSAQYMFANTGYCIPNSKEPIYVWMCRKENNKFGNIQFGTRIEFESKIQRKFNSSNVKEEA